MQRNIIYLDHSATTPVLPAVVEAMAPYWNEQYGNPSSHHRTGYIAARAVNAARERVADILGTEPDAIVFTGCGSESNNIALRGVLTAASAAGRGKHLITSAVEHSAVLATARQLRDYFGFELTILPTDEYGRVRLADVEAGGRLLLARRMDDSPKRERAHGGSGCCVSRIAWFGAAGYP